MKKIQLSAPNWPILMRDALLAAHSERRREVICPRYPLGVLEVIHVDIGQYEPGSLTGSPKRLQKILPPPCPE